MGIIHAPLPAVHASSAHADSVLVCGVGHEEWRRDHSRPAPKRAAELNVGEPRTVRLVLFSPNDRPFRVGLVDSIKTAIMQSQAFFAEQMQAHGYGYKTFRFETDAQGEPLAHRVVGQHPESHYFEKTPGTLHARWIGEIEHVFDLEENVYVIYRDITRFTGPAGGHRYTKKRGTANLPARAGWRTLAHEMAHAFGLPHDYRDGAYILSYGGPSQIPGARTWDRISACAADFLSVHPYFNSDIPVEELSPPVIKLVSPMEYQGGVRSVSIKLEVSDAQGLHQVLLYAHPGYGYGGLRECRSLAGRRDALVDFEYNGSSMAADPQRAITTLSDSIHLIQVRLVDTDGNVTRLRFDLVPDRVADVLKGHTDSINAVAFSPDRKTLASGSSDGTVKLWHVARRELLGTLEGHSNPVMAVAFSRDGTLATGSSSGIKLWDVTSRQEIADLEGMAPVAFSRDGNVLASGSPNRTIAIWDATSLEKIATLKGHSGQVKTVAFSPDGSMLASGSGDNVPGEHTVRLWDVSGRTEIATTEHAGPIWSVAFSSVGGILALVVGSPDNAVRLWHVGRRTEVARLWPRGPFLSLAYSPGGEVLASGSTDGKVRIWDPSTRELIGTFLAAQPFQPSESGVRSLAFSPDGTTLAAGLRNHTIKLRDVSEWAGPRPASLEIISGDDQQGAPGDPLDQPLEVEVRDQYGDPLPDASVTFTVTDSDGISTEATATTNADGRATATLTLGRRPGPNTVVATVGNLKPVTFTVTAITNPDFDGDGTVGFSDFVQFAGKFGLSEGDEGYDARFDLDGNGAIGFSDFVIFAGAFGKS